MKPDATLAAIRAGSRNVRFRDFVRLAEALGLEEAGGRGSHLTMKRPGTVEMLTLQMAGDGTTKPYQMKQLLRIIDKYGLSL